MRPDPVPQESTALLLQAAIAAQIPVNLQPWAFVVVTDPALRATVDHHLVNMQEMRVFDALLGMPSEYPARLMGLYEGFEQTPCFIIVCLEPKVEFAQPEHAAAIRQWHLLSLGAAMQNLMVAATALGLGTRWFGGIALDEGGGALKELLGTPAHGEVIAPSPVGCHGARV